MALHGGAPAPQTGSPAGQGGGLSDLPGQTNVAGGQMNQKTILRKLYARAMVEFGTELGKDEPDDMAMAVARHQMMETQKKLQGQGQQQAPPPQQAQGGPTPPPGIVDSVTGRNPAELAGSIKR